MTDGQATAWRGRSLKRSFGQRFQAFVRKHVWRQDIHPTAWIAPTALIDRTWPRGIHIGEDCVLDHDTVVLAHDMTRGLYVDTVIGPRCYVGPRAIIMPGVTIGADCVIAPGALVVKDVPAGSQVTGNPGKLAGPTA